MKKARPIFSVCLLVLITLISLRFLFFTSYIQLQKSKFREQLINSNLKELVSVKFAEKDLFQDRNGFEWKEDNKELVIEGTYYEVVCIKKAGASALVFIVEDKEENKRFHHFFSQNKTDFSFFLELVKLLSDLTFITQPKVQMNSLELNTNSWTHYLYCVPGAFHHKTIKPPQLV